MKARVIGLHHGVKHPNYDPKRATGAPGPRVPRGSIIEVTQQELTDFADKLERVGDDTPLTYTKKQLAGLIEERGK